MTVCCFCYLLELSDQIAVHVSVVVGKESTCTLEDVLVFFTGASAIPPLGFSGKPKLVFLETPTEKLPTASTCDLHLRIPTVHGDSFNAFKEWMELGILGNSGFGEV